MINYHRFVNCDVQLIAIELSMVLMNAVICESNTNINQCIVSSGSNSNGNVNERQETLAHYMYVHTLRT